MGWAGTEMQVGKEECGRNGGHLLSHLFCLPCTLLFFSSGLGFLREEFVLTTGDQEHMWVGWPGAVTSAE